MIREKVKVEVFEKIAKENEYFLWHFLGKDQSGPDSILGLWSYFDIKLKDKDDQYPHAVRVLIDEFPKVPYFESYTEDSMDFLINLGLNVGELFRIPPDQSIKPLPRSFFYNPVVLGFHRRRLVYHTHKTCYCVEGMLEVIEKLNPELLVGD
jgi:hypothetical protein